MSFCKAWLLAGALMLGAGTGPAFAQEAAGTPLASAASAPAAIPFKREPVATGEIAWRTLAALVVCLSLGGLTIYVLRARGKGGSLLLPTPGRLQVVESRRIGPKAMLLVVRWNGEELLLSHGEGGTTLIARTPAPAAPEGAK